LNQLSNYLQIDSSILKQSYKGAEL